MSTTSIEHIVVLMLENRSYDNVLGGLYINNAAPDGQQDLDGLNTGTYSNVDPTNPSEGIFYVAAASSTTIPQTDPGEPFADMAQQIWGIAGATPSITGNPTSYGDFGAMGGFTQNYMNQLNHGPLQDVMTYLTPDQVPVTAFLAQNFAVSDQWFGSVPTQTFANRMFTHCGAAGTNDLGSSLLDDVEYGIGWTGGIFGNDTPKGPVDLNSVFAQLDNVYGTDNGPNWKVYFHDFPNTVLIDYVMQQAQSSTNANISTFDNADWGNRTPELLLLHLGKQKSGYPLAATPDTFMEDIANGTLPMYSFIEPRYSNGFGNLLAPNSNHPGSAVFLSTSKSPAIDVNDGEILLANVYNAINNSDYWDNTLLVVIYDEHGGMYDHVTAPAATPPASDTNAHLNGYTYNTFGPRVPALLISPWIAAGTTFRPSSSTPFDHSTIVKTLFDCFGLATDDVPYLTDRDNAAESLMPFVDFNITANNPGQVTVPSS